MRAALFSGGHDIALAEAPDPVPGPGEALVRVRAAGICGSDLHTYRDPGRVWGGLGIPYMTGHELAGEVAALGPGVTGLEVGQRVAVEPRHLVGCGHCIWCRRGDYQLCPELGRVGGRPTYSTGFAEYSLEEARNLYPLPDHVSMEEASLLDVYACGMHAVHRAPAGPLQTVAILGAGAIGLTAAECYRLAGARRVIVCGRGERALEVARRGGADLVDITRDDPVRAVRELTGGQGAGVVVEAVGGRAQTFEAALAMAAPGGTVLIIGGYTQPQTFSAREAQRKELNVLWSWSYGLWQGVPEFQVALEWLAAGKLRAKELVTHTFPLERILEAFACADEKRRTGAIKVVVVP